MKRRHTRRHNRHHWHRRRLEADAVPERLDGTLHGTSPEAQDGLKRWRAFWRQTEAPIGSALCYNTGRCITDYLAILQPELPVPDVLITGDGTEIRWCVNGTLVLDAEWSQLVGTSWQRLQQPYCAQ